MKTQSLIDEIIQLPVHWHDSGSLRTPVLEAILRNCSSLNISHSLETGAGKSTLLFSHLSPHHLVFALDVTGKGSVSQTMRSNLLNNASLELIEGPTQKTLPAYQFDNQLQVALLDGPHAYPFPDLEYYYIYPHLSSGALLIIDDIHIPTVRNLFKFCRADDMFDLIEVVRETAFFRRTESPTFYPFGDGWMKQKYNLTLKHQLVSFLQTNLPQPIVEMIRRLRK